MPFLGPAYLNLLRELVVSQFKLRDQSTFLGFLWSFLNPILMLLVLFAFFSRNIGQSIAQYPLYLLLGLVHYTHYANATSAAMVVPASMRPLMRDTVFPKELLVLASVMASSIDFAIAVAVCLAIAFSVGVRPTLALIQLPTVFTLQVLMVTWVSFFLTSLYVYVRDIQHLYQVFLRVLFFVTPIFYSASMVDNGIAGTLLQLNPLTHLVALSRNIVIEGTEPEAGQIVVLVVVNGLMVIAGLVAFRRFESSFAERL
jgi:ABC-type polysaccharide/polyol phosphate export permease